MKRRALSSVERRLELIELAVEMARAEYDAGKRSASSLAAFERKAARDRENISVMLRGFRSRRQN